MAPSANPVMVNSKKLLNRNAKFIATPSDLGQRLRPGWLPTAAD